MPGLIVVLLLVVLAPWPAPAATATARRGMVATEHELASEAGAEVLAAGGNAIDAIVAAAFATGVVNPTSSGIGGGGFALLRHGKTGELHVLDFRESAPGAAHRDLFVRDGEVDPRSSLRGGLAVAVPGEVRGLAMLVERYGKLPLSRVLQPAIRLAAEGFPTGRHLATQIVAHVEELRARPELRKVFLKADGSPFSTGERLRRPDLASTLRLLSAKGPDAFYTGEIAAKIEAAVAAEGGVLTRSDLGAYRVRDRQPVLSRYRGVTVASVPPPSSGGGVILEILNVLSGYDLAGGGPQDPLTLHRIAEASKLAFADRARHYGDPQFTAVPLERLLSAGHAAALRARIHPDRVLPPAAQPGLSADHGTSHLSAVDAAGWAVALTTTVNTAFGAMVVPEGTGILLNNQMDDFSAAPGEPNVYGLVGTEANSVAAGKRPLSSMSPTLVLRGKHPLLSVGGSGGPRIISATLQTILNVVDFGMSLPDAVRSPRLHHQWLPNLLFFEPGLEGAATAALRAKGHELREVGDLAAVQAVLVTPDGLVGVSDDRKGGVPVGW